MVYIFSVTACEGEGPYYRKVLVTIPSACMVLTVAALVTLSILLYSRKTCCRSKLLTLLFRNAILWYYL